MPRELILVRHAKSSWADSDLQDFDRPLNHRGQKNAPEMGRRLAEQNARIDCIISSPAMRAISTAELLAGEIGFEKNQIIKEPKIYEASLGTLVKLITEIEDYYSNAMFVGHNPGFTYLCNFLCNAEIDNLPTCSIVTMKFDIDKWEQIDEFSGELVNFDYPKKM